MASSQADIGQLKLVDIRVHPNSGKIGDGVKLLIRHDPHPLENIFFDHKTAYRREQRETSLGPAAFLQLADLIFGDVPESKSAVRGFQK
jgi:hypothetical protein